MTGGDVQHAACERLRWAEEHHNLLDLQVDGWAIWPLFRLHCGYELMALPRGSRLPPSRALLASTLLGDLWRWICLRPAPLTIVTPASSRIERENGRHTNPVVDFLAHDLPASGQLDDPNNSAYYRPRREVAVPPVMTLWGPKLLGMLGARLRRPAAAVVQLATELQRRLRTVMGERTPDLAYLSGHIQRFLLEKAVYRRLFRRLSTRVLLVTSYGYHSQVAAARDAGIASFELQHGFVDPESHFGYAWSAAAVPVRRSIPVADHFLAYGRHWQEGLERLAFWRDRVRVVGNARIDAYRQARRAGPRPAGAPRRLVWASDGICVAESVAFLRDLIRAAKTAQVPLELVVSLHPAYEAQDSHYAELRGESANVRLTSPRTGASTLAEIARADLHLTISSTCHYEAISLGVPTVVAQLPTWEKVEPLLASGLAHAAARGADVLPILGRLGPGAIPDPAAAEAFFASGARGLLGGLLSEALAGRLPDHRPPTAARAQPVSRLD